MRDAKLDPPTEAGYWNVSFVGMMTCLPLFERFDGTKWANDTDQSPLLPNTMHWWEGTRSDTDPTVRFDHGQ